MLAPLNEIFRRKVDDSLKRSANVVKLIGLESTVFFSFLFSSLLFSPTQPNPTQPNPIQSSLHFASAFFVNEVYARTDSSSRHKIIVFGERGEGGKGERGKGGKGEKEKGKGLRLRARSFALDHFWLTDSGEYEGGKLDCIYGIVTV